MHQIAQICTYIFKKISPGIIPTDHKNWGGGKSPSSSSRFHRPTYSDLARPLLKSRRYLRLVSRSTTSSQRLFVDRLLKAQADVLWLVTTLRSSQVACCSVCDWPPTWFVGVQRRPLHTSVHSAAACRLEQLHGSRTSSARPESNTNIPLSQYISPSYTGLTSWILDYFTQGRSDGSIPVWWAKKSKPT